ncbi:GATA zinc finger [Colletotrichum abscissum]|uniref:GATA zinc finger n=1 Tax=Colletotrichum abscissum TaxID=1671311 RepID=UPI0027D4C414|nr:GATA zinc finger [Colletotrichum abscissum]KAK1520942.1 GATA zinc finger [Colletotrichum abscissum]
MMEATVTVRSFALNAARPRPRLDINNPTTTFSANAQHTAVLPRQNQVTTALDAIIPLFTNPENPATDTHLADEDEDCDAISHPRPYAPVALFKPAPRERKVQVGRLNEPPTGCDSTTLDDFLHPTTTIDRYETTRRLVHHQRQGPWDADAIAMEAFYPQLTPQELQRQMSQQSQQRQMQSQGQGGGHGYHQMNQGHGMSMMGGNGDSLDDIINSNNHELQRRRSIHQPYMPSNQNNQNAGADRRMSMMEFGADDNQMLNYPFQNPTMNGEFSNMAGQMGNGMNGGMDGGMTNNGGMGNSVPGNISIPGGMEAYAAQDGLQMSPTNAFTTFSPDMMSSMMPPAYANMGMPTTSSMNMYGQTSMANAFPSPLNTTANDMTMDLGADETPGTAPQSALDTPLDIDNADNEALSMGQQYRTPADNSNRPIAQVPKFGSVSSGPQTTPSTLSREVSTNSGQTSSQSPNNQSSSMATSQTAASAAPAATAETTPAMGPQTPRAESKEKNVYSKSGFDMMRALWYVATRKDPEIHLGAVDMSCAFVVCDVSLNDCPIIYVSDNFQNLTGYSRHEIVGQNCRFLQAPDAKVEAGSKREFVDDASVYNLKKKIAEGREVQQSLINYRKGGKPFLNLLTMIPIPWDDPNEVRFFVGFQIDLVECPDAISQGQDAGGVKVNYKHSDIGQYIWTPPNQNTVEAENGQTLGVDDVSTLLQQFNPKGVVSDWHKQSWDKMLLENTDDVVHVLSLKGLFLYLSPSCKRVLEYDATELVGNSLSTVCHPSDIVPVTRELKDATAGNSVNIVFRIRRKQSGYTWFESHGSLFFEHGKGRKCIILVGRKRPVFALSRRDLEAHGGIGDSELWTKISVSGMFLFVSSNIRSLLDLQPDTLIGTSMQELMRRESRAEFGRAIEKARRGKIVTCKHEVHNRRGQVLQAQTILYPGDASDGQKPTFLLAQTKLLKASSRSIAPAATPPGSVKSTSQVNQNVQLATQSTELAKAGPMSLPGGQAMHGSQDAALASDDNIFDELRTTKCSSWQFELRQMEKVNRILAEELGGLLSNKKKRKRRKGVGNVVRDCANCHTRNTPEWRRGPSGQRDLCNSCGLRWAKQVRSAEPSVLQNEVKASSSTPARPSDSSGNGTPATSVSVSKSHQGMPPPSQPLLEGGSGGGMTSIRE